MHIFKYSKRKGTVAASMECQVEESIKIQRSDVLLEMSKKQSVTFRIEFIGAHIEVLMEELKTINGIHYWIGHTMNYVLAAIQSEDNLSNKLIKGKAVGLLHHDIILIE